MALLRCYVCRNLKSPDQFYRDAHRPSGHASRCKKCDNVRANGGRVQTRLELIRRAKDHPCVDCGVTYPTYVMDLDHRPGTEKLFELSNARRFPTIAVIDEIPKCDPVCANCHRKRTAQRIRDAGGNPTAISEDDT